MSIHTSRTAHPIPGAGRGATVGTWGLWLGMVALAMLVAGMAAAALYLHTGQDAWPPEGIEQPGAWHAVVAVALAALGAAAATLALRRMRKAERRRAAVGLAVALVLVTAASVVLVAELGALTFRWDVHAYGSVYWILTATSAFFLAVAALAVGVVLLQTLTGLVDEDRHLELTNTAIYTWFAFGVAVVLLALVHLLPATTGGVL